MGQKRISRAEAQAGMTWIENELRDCDSYADEVQDGVRAALGSMSIPAQHEGDMLENEERITRHYKQVSEILRTRAREEVEKCMPEAETYKSAERLAFIRRRELERLNLDKTDPELDERQWQMLSDIKAKLVEYPVLLGEVTGDDTFMQAVKKSYEAKLEGYETNSKKLIHNIFKLPKTCSDKVSTLLEGFAETSLKPAINIVKLQHERLETELGEANQRSEGLDKRIESLEAEVEEAGAEKIRLDMDHQAREESHTQEIATLKEKLEAERRVNQDQNDEYKRETTDLKSQLEKARTSATNEVNTCNAFQKELQSSREIIKDLEKDLEECEEDVQLWTGRVNARGQEYDDLKAKYEASKEQVNSAQRQVFSMKEDLQAEKESLRNELKAVKEARNSAESQIQSIKSQLLTARKETASLTESSTRDIRSFQNQLSAEKIEKESLRQSHEDEIQTVQSQLLTARTETSSLKQSNARQVRQLQNEIALAEAEKESLQHSHDDEIQAVHSQLLTARTEINSLKQSNVRQIQQLQNDISTAEAEKESLQQLHEDEIQAVQSQLSKARTEITSLKQSNARQVQQLQGDISTAEAEKESLQQSHEDEIQRVQSHLSKARTEMTSLKQSNARQVQELQSELSTEKAKTESLREAKKTESQVLQSQLLTAKKDIYTLEQSTDSQVQMLQSEISTMKVEKESLSQEWENTFQSLQRQLSTAESEKKSLKQTSDDASESFQSQLSSMKSDKQSLEKEIQSLQSELSSVKSDNESLKHSLEKEMQSLRDQLSVANDTNESLVKSKQELETRSRRATKGSEIKSQLLGLHISILDNFDMEGSESEDVFLEMGNLFGMTAQYTGSTTEMVSMPKCMPGMTLVGKATNLPEPNLTAARRLWISSRCGSLALDVAQAFFMQQEISSDQFALLPWIHASLNRAAISMCEKSTLTPDVARTLLYILRGLVYTATVAREWSEDHVWNPMIEEILAQITHWLREHVPNDEASLLTMIVGQVNETLTTHESPSTSISPSLFAEAQRIDSANSDIPEGMAMVIDNSGMIILFTADDNAFVFGASEVKVMEVDYSASILIKFDDAVLGLPATLTEVRLLNRHTPFEIYERHYPLLKSVLTENRIAVVYPFKRQRTR